MDKSNDGYTMFDLDYLNNEEFLEQQRIFVGLINSLTWDYYEEKINGSEA